jgi:urease accessory protein
MDEPEHILTALQLGDSFFPSGAFAHSSGLEQFVSDGLVSDREELVGFIESFLLGLVARCDALFVKLAYSHGNESNIAEIRRCDHLIHAMKLPKELRLASMQMGRQVLQVAKDLYPSSIASPLLMDLELKGLHGHHPVIFGAVCGNLGMGMENTLLTYLYSTVSSLVSAGLRLIPIGHSDGQLAINGLKPLIARIAREAQHLEETDISAFAPAIELRAMQHEHLRTRLFKS